MGPYRLFNYQAASWMRPFLCGAAACLAAIAACASSALGEAVPPSKAALIRRILAQSIRSQKGRNIRGNQMEWVQTPAGSNQISFKSYTRTSDGRGFTVVRDDTGHKLALIVEDG